MATQFEQVKERLEYYLGRKVTSDEVEEALEWMEYSESDDLAQWVEAMIQVGGLTDFADGNGAVLVRGSEGGKQYSVRLGDLLKRGDISANVGVKPGDIIIVPQSWF